MIRSYPEILCFNAFTFPDRIALHAEGSTLTYRQLFETANQVAAALLEKGIQRGNRIAFLDLNTLPYVHMVNACFLIGAVPVSINWRLSASEMEHIVRDASCNYLCFGQYFSDTANKISAITEKIVVEDFVLTAANKSVSAVQHENNGSDLALLVYTSGTTGMPKGVRLSHDNLFEMYYALRSITPEFGATSVNLVAGPWYAVVGIGYFIFGVFAGCTNVLLRIFDPLEVCRLIDAHKVTNAFLPPVMLRVICGLEDDLDDFDLSSMKHIQYGGAPMDPALLTKSFAVFKCKFTQGYGLTETSGIGTALRYDVHDLALQDESFAYLLRSAGKPYEGVAIKIVSDQGNEVAANEPGEVYLKGAVVAQGYLHLLQDGAKEFDADGWFHTGDMGYLNELGYLFLIDRKNDLIISKGNNIYPAEIEQIVQSHPHIVECAVMAVPHATYGEAVGIAVVLKDNALTLKSLREWLQDRIADVKMPVVMDVWESLPRNPTGKVLRKELRAKHWENTSRKIN